MKHKIHFTRPQVDFLIEKLGAEDSHEAIEIFVKIIKEEHIDPLKMHEYLEKLMDRYGA